MLNDRSDPVTFLATRRSGKPRDLGLPGPSGQELERMCALAARTPDHGKLAPWRFVIVEDRERFARVLADAFRAERPGVGDPDAIGQFAHQAPALVAVLSSPKPGPIPVWEQELSAGAACMNLLHAAGALGYAGGWLTGWATYSPAVLATFGGPGERIAGFLFIGTPTRALEERPRPDVDQLISRW